MMNRDNNSNILAGVKSIFTEACAKFCAYDLRPYKLSSESLDSLAFICLALITRKISEEDLPPLSETDVEPAPLRLPNNGPPHAGDATCIVIPSRSLTSSLRTPNVERSRSNSIDDNETEEVLDPSTNDLIIL
ncbi:unnamed protein product [Rotaria sordida]|uniref:Uncharacterized protein n=1 Tax=Rotaria sordida TaxID=392033 RepID=A0A819ZG05_9BILA|nr:unnamed protein product [Rotaria sordida]